MFSRAEVFRLLIYWYEAVYKSETEHKVPSPVAESWSGSSFSMKRLIYLWLRQNCNNSSALAMELLQSCTKPSIWYKLNNILHFVTIAVSSTEIYTCEEREIQWNPSGKARNFSPKVQNLVPFPFFINHAYCILLTTGYPFWKAIILGGLYRGVPLYMETCIERPLTVKSLI